MKIEKTYNSIDLFCGAGGLSLGFQRAGFKTLFAVEFNKIYAQTYKANFPEVDLYCGDIKNISNIEIENLGKKAEVDIIIGGPPCQGFSLAGNIGRLFLEDERNRLFLEYFRFVDILKPRMFVLENVASMVTHNKGKTIKEIEEKFHSIGYEIQYKILNAVNYNVPQERRRVFIVGTQKGISFRYPLENSNIITVSLKPLVELEQTEKAKVRDPYLQHLYKLELIREYKHVYAVNEGACVLEKMPYPVLIASHIKPYSKSGENEKFDSDNGLLLSKNMDSLFDLGYITFDNDGTIITSTKLNEKVATYVKQYKLDSVIFNDRRKVYMEYHRLNVFQG